MDDSDDLIPLADEVPPTPAPPPRPTLKGPAKKKTPADLPFAAPDINDEEAVEEEEEDEEPVAPPPKRPASAPAYLPRRKDYEAVPAESAPASGPASPKTKAPAPSRKEKGPERAPIAREGPIEKPSARDKAKADRAASTKKERRSRALDDDGEKKGVLKEATPEFEHRVTRASGCAGGRRHRRGRRDPSLVVFISQQMGGGESESGEQPEPVAADGERTRPAAGDPQGQPRQAGAGGPLPLRRGPRVGQAGRRPERGPPAHAGRRQLPQHQGRRGRPRGARQPEPQPADVRRRPDRLGPGRPAAADGRRAPEAAGGRRRSPGRRPVEAGTKKAQFLPPTTPPEPFRETNLTLEKASQAELDSGDVQVHKIPEGFRARPGIGIHPNGWPLEITCDKDGAAMVLIPGGEFVQGRERGISQRASGARSITSPPTTSTSTRSRTGSTGSTSARRR